MATITPVELIPGWDLHTEAVNDRLDVELLARAYRFSERAHSGQTRRNGDPYVTHCVEVAKILADLQLDSVTVASGLIHDVVEDTAGHGRRSRARVRPRDRADRRRPDEDRPPPAHEHAGAAGRELPQAAALDREGRARHPHQARRPPAQHADARVHAAREAAAHLRRRRATCTRRSRTASASRP